MISKKLPNGTSLEKIIGYVHCPNRVWGKLGTITEINEEMSNVVISVKKTGKEMTYRIHSE